MINQVTLLGHLGADPDVRFFPDGTSITMLRLATTEKWKDKATGERKEATEWHRVELRGPVAEAAAQYLKKGSKVFIQGSNSTRKYTDKNGKDVYSFVVRGKVMKMLDGNPSGYQPSQPEQRSQAKPASQNHPIDEFDDDIPF